MPGRGPATSNSKKRKAIPMARKKPRKRSWLRMMVLFLVTPLVVWLIAFLLWFYWYDLRRLFSPEEERRPVPKAAKPAEKSDRRERRAPPQEKIFEDDRKKLEDILKQRN
jgi:hypothetical protein